jgi:SAM-dependent methyltransferase
MRSAYAEDLAFVHHMGFGTVAHNAAATLLERWKPAGEGALIVEVGCGSGIGARLLTEAGHDVLGIEPSPAFLELARRNAPRAKFRKGSFATAKLPRCHAITAIGEVLGYATEARSGWPEVLGFFERAHRALHPGGLFLFDVAGPGRVPKPGHKIHPLWLYPPAGVKEALRAAGFRVQILRSYGDFKFPAGLTGFAARKPSRL